VEALPPRRKDLGGSESGLPAIKIGPREIRSAGVCRHRSAFVQSRRRHGSRPIAVGEDVHDVLWPPATRAHATGGPEMTSRPTAASDRMIGHEGSNSDRRKLNFADRG
jgi:hypothetical protein